MLPKSVQTRPKPPQISLDPSNTCQKLTRLLLRWSQVWPALAKLRRVRFELGRIRDKPERPAHGHPPLAQVLPRGPTPCGAILSPGAAREPLGRKPMPLGPRSSTAQAPLGRCSSHARADAKPQFGRRITVRAHGSRCATSSHWLRVRFWRWTHRVCMATSPRLNYDLARRASLFRRAACTLGCARMPCLWHIFGGLEWGAVAFVCVCGGSALASREDTTITTNGPPRSGRRQGPRLDEPSDNLLDDPPGRHRRAEIIKLPKVAEHVLATHPESCPRRKGRASTLMES